MRDQDLGDEDHHEELECQRSAPNSLLYSVLGDNLENLQKYHDEELECSTDEEEYCPGRKP